jgi:hypothetical protein
MAAWPTTANSACSACVTRWQNFHKGCRKDHTEHFASFWTINTNQQHCYSRKCSDGDGLSQVHLQAFKDILHTLSYSFENWYEMAQLLSKALDQCFMLPGDLHGGGFRFLVVVYNLYYGGFIQPIQTALGWKWIHPKLPAGGRVSNNDTAGDRTSLISCLLGNDCITRQFEAWIWCHKG